jgi:hypothetical protein
MVNIKLPDGSVRSFDHPVTVGEVAASIGAGLAKAALAGRVDGKQVDLSHSIAQDAELAIITDRNPEGLEILRHSTSHLLAHAVKELFPEAQVTIGPVIEHGFFYDFSYKRPFTPEDLVAIEKRMSELSAKDEPVVRRVLPRDEAVSYFKGIGEHYKAEIIASIPSNEEVSLYREGSFEDLCRGPHVPSTGKLKVAFSAPIWSDDHGADDRRVIGVLLMSFDVGLLFRSVDAIGSWNASRAPFSVAVIDLRDDMIDGEPKGGLVLENPEVARTDLSSSPDLQLVRAPMEVVTRLKSAFHAHPQFGKPARPAGPQDDAGLDAEIIGLFPGTLRQLMGGDGTGPQIAAAEPIRILGRPDRLGDVGWAVLVHER